MNQTKKSILIILVAGVAIFAYIKYMPHSTAINTNKESDQSTDIKQKAVEMFVVSQKLLARGDMFAVIDYVEDTNDPGELEDLQTLSGYTVPDLRKELQASPELLAEFNKNIKAVGENMSFVAPGFLTSEFFANEKLWRITSNPNGSTDVIYNNEHVLRFKDGTSILGDCLLGALLTKEGEWRALPISAFRCE